MAPKSIETEITIEAHPSEVWKILLDFPRYKQWNPYIRNVELPIHSPKLTESSVWKILPMEVTVEPVDTLIADLSTLDVKTKMEVPICLIVSEDQELRWYKTTKGPNWWYKAEHYFILTDRGNDVTQLRHGERISGLVQKFKGNRSYMQRTKRQMELMNEALKRRVEEYVEHGYNYN